jgi:phospholipid/cholesterol/gamma-HCH transport system substrate-binding protein
MSSRMADMRRAFKNFHPLSRFERLERFIDNFKPFRERNPIVVGFVSVGVLAVAVLFALSLNRFTFLRGVYIVKADFADASGLNPENEVRVAGLKVGKVRSVELQKTNGVFDRVRVVMEVSGKTKLGDTSQAEIKLKTLLGAKFVDILPSGRAPYVREDRIIPLSRTRIPFELYEVTNRTVKTIGEIDAKALNSALHELANLTDDPKGNLGRSLQGLAKASRGLKDRDAELQTLLRSGGEILDVLGSRSAALGRIVDSGAQLLTALALRRDALATFASGSDRLAVELTDLIRKNRTNLDPALRDLHQALDVVRKDLKPLEHTLQVLGPDAKSFGSAFTQGHWGDIWLQTVLDIPVQPLPVSAPPASSQNSLRSIYAAAAR